MPQATILHGNLTEIHTNQHVYPLNWDETEGWVEVYLNGQRVKLDISEIRHQGQPVVFSTTTTEV